MERRVLVVEDEFLLAEELEHLLQRHGWRVLGPAASVAGALRLLAEGERPHAALLDLNLGGETVAPLAEVLRALDIPFVLVSAHNRPELITPLLAGVPNVGKPADEHLLLAALVEAVGC